MQGCTFCAFSSTFKLIGYAGLVLCRKVLKVVRNER